MASLTEKHTVKTLMELNVHYGNDDDDLLDQPLLYRRLIGSLIYLTITRPDIAFAVLVVSQFIATPVLFT